MPLNMTDLHITRNPIFLFLSMLALAGLCAASIASASAQVQGRQPGARPPPPRAIQRRARPPKLPKPIPLEKVEALIERQHQEADQDRNGYLTVAEVRAQIDAMAEAIVVKRFEKIDTDGNSSVSYPEFSAWQRSMGSQALDDVAAASVDQSMIPESLPFEIKDRKQEQALSMLIRPLNVTILSQADSNYDGQVSVQELKLAQSKRFKDLDQNSDGFLVFDELPGPDEDSDGSNRPPPPLTP